MAGPSGPDRTDAGDPDAFADSRRSPVQVGASPIHARGLFAARDLAAGDVLDAGPVLVFPEGEPDDASLLLDYVFDLDGVRNCLVLGPSSLCNHADDPNAEVSIEPDELTFVLYAVRAIRAGDEIVIDYGADYWADR